MLTVQEWGEIAKIAAPIVGPIIAVALAMWQFRAQKIKEGRIRALEIDRAWSALRDVRNVVDGAFPPGKLYPMATDPKNKAVPIEVLDEVFRDNSILVAVKVILGHWEALALTVAAEATDEQMAYELIADTFVGYASRFENFVKRRQQKESASLYVFFVALARRWAKELENYKPTFALPRPK